MLSHGNTKKEKHRERVVVVVEEVEGRPALASSQTDTNRQLQSEDCCLFGEGKKKMGGVAGGGAGGKKKGRKIYLIRDCQESVFTCKIASE